MMVAGMEWVVSKKTLFININIKRHVQLKEDMECTEEEMVLSANVMKFVNTSKISTR